MGKWKQKVDEVILRNSVYAMHIKEYKAGEKKRRAFYNFAHLFKKKTLTSHALNLATAAVACNCVTTPLALLLQDLRLIIVLLLLLQLILYKLRERF